MSRSARPSIYIENRVAVWSALVVTAATVFVLLMASARTPILRQTASTESSEVTAPTRARLSLTVHLATKQLRLRMEGATVWNAPAVFVSDSAAMVTFADGMRLSGSDSAVIRRVHLFEASRPVDDSILAIVARADGLPIENLQRFVPERFLLELSNGDCIDILTDLPGTRLSLIDNALEEGRALIRSLTGGRCLTVRLSAREGMSLFGACRAGMTVTIL